MPRKRATEKRNLEDHLSPETFHDFIENRGSTRRLARTEAHLDGCAECVETLALIVSMDRPASREEEAILARFPRVSPEERLEELREAIVSSVPVRGGLSAFDWRSVAVAASVAALLFSGGLYLHRQYWLPSESRRIAAETLARLVDLRQATGRIPLRYLPELERASVTRSGFDVAEPGETVMLGNLREAVERAPEPEAVQTLALLLLDEGGLDEAERLFNRLVDAQPANAAALNGLAVVQFRRAETRPEDAYALRQRGLAFLRRAQGADPENLLVMYNLGKFYEALGMDTAATQAWMRYLEKDPDSQWAEEAAYQLAQLGGR